MRTLVLNAGFEPLHTISWQRAICLIFTAKAEVVEEYTKIIRSVSTAVNLPKVIRLTKYVRMFHNYGIAKCTRKNLLLRDNHECQYCGTKVSSAEATLDHIVPKSKGGKNDFLNLVVCCQKCNHKKGNKLLSQTKMKLRKRPKIPLISELGGFSEASEFMRKLEQSLYLK